MVSRQAYPHPLFFNSLMFVLWISSPKSLMLLIVVVDAPALVSTHS